MTLSKEELAVMVDEIEWELLRAHLERGGLIVVGRELDLVDAGVSMAANDAAVIQRWIEAGELTKPSAEQIATWNAVTRKIFRMLIVSPYVLIQEQLH